MTDGIYQVFWTQTAQQDLIRILEYIAADSEIQAGRVYLAIRQKADNLRQMPLQGRIVPELKYYGIIIYRELISPPWRIVYKTEQNKVWVLAVIDGRRNVEDILLDRFI
ncbi:MAG: type II toxin-antitoxin system RelE/ParE family toxin [Eubacteriales bacterium]|jgi:plasmid stabilization system protein ParE|nr:type II toxin-antitoxin system RelE/ParE family toxin [Bacillota bacterium]MBV1728114.1 type II toxin-antitoxin system RelE/ParE family toxin [Desulforudis sp.]MDP3050642.1 type II toxin-antitoxin system RelE/ParE family toxin [Eubacteriales bacterium]MDQ7790087.1 type II toxin-antitoxin system RelE/ParE family toxin [Clostridia bacterium]MBU4553495.1 type II toxin-antitoxin system RelE/ParE family toxin [Bacillota bacterium]